MMMIPIISKTAVTSKITVSKLSENNSDISPIYESRNWDEGLRVDLSPDLSTILGTRYLENQPYNKILVYDYPLTWQQVQYWTEEPIEGFRVSLEPLQEEHKFESDVYWRKIGQNPKAKKFNHDEDAQWFIAPIDELKEGEYKATVVLDNGNIPRHLVCNVV